jgi:hypothetical protein
MLNPFLMIVERGRERLGDIFKGIVLARCTILCKADCTEIEMIGDCQL